MLSCPAEFDLWGVVQIFFKTINAHASVIDAQNNAACMRVPAETLMMPWESVSTLLCSRPAEMTLNRNTVP